MRRGCRRDFGRHTGAARGSRSRGLRHPGEAGPRKLGLKCALGRHDVHRRNMPRSAERTLIVASSNGGADDVLQATLRGPSKGTLWPVSTSSAEPVRSM
jgi:hypothetical protein